MEAIGTLIVLAIAFRLLAAIALICQALNDLRLNRFTAICPQCAEELKIPLQFAGAQGSCNHCQHHFTAPYPEKISRLLIKLPIGIFIGFRNPKPTA